MESIPHTEFRPPFCPNSACPVAGDRQRKRFHAHGVYIRECDRRVVRRFRCVICEKTCSQQTFAVTYYLKRPDLLHAIARGQVAGSCHRQLGRSLGCAPSTVMRQTARAGRHCILFHARCLRELERIVEPIVYDDFECFAHSQDQPMGLGTAVGQDSWFTYSLERAPHRIGGTRARRTRGPRRPQTADKGAYARAISATVDVLLPKVPDGARLELVTDGHQGYRSGLARHPQGRRIRHRCVPNPARGPKGSPRSPQAIVRDRQMFAVDLEHKLLRHSQAHHRRETIAFARRHNAVLERGFLFAVWRNFVKARSERRPDPTTPAMWLGLTPEPWTWARVFAQRLFPWKETVPERWMTLYRRQWFTPAIGPNRTHALVNAF